STESEFSRVTTPSATVESFRCGYRELWSREVTRRPPSNDVPDQRYIHERQQVVTRSYESLPAPAEVGDRINARMGMDGVDPDAWTVVSRMDQVITRYRRDDTTSAH